MSFKKLRESVIERTFSPEEQQDKVLHISLALFYEPLVVLNFMFIVLVYCAVYMLFFYPKGFKYSYYLLGNELISFKNNPQSAESQY